MTSWRIELAPARLAERFSASRFWDDIRESGAVAFNALGAMIPILLKQPARPDDADNPARVCLSAACPAWAWDEFQTRFRQESKLAASIDHPNVIPIFDAGEEGDSLYVTMRFVTGTDLRQLAAGGGLDPARAARIVAQAAEALDAAHARGLVHRDVKPGNVLIESPGGEEHAFLTDFGLTKQVSSDPSITETGNWLGTVDYAAPEQIRATPIVSPSGAGLPSSTRAATVAQVRW